MATFDLERSFNTKVIGIDEAGRGPWAGPVVIAGVKFNTYEHLPDWVVDINDSKKLSAKKRLKLYHEIMDSTGILEHHISVISVAVIDQVNILEATMIGMRECMDALRKRDEIVLVDGNRQPVKKSWCKPLVKGDNLSISIAAASIIAKVYRDKLMDDLSKEHPEYGWDKNAGYGTRYHQNALKMYGITHYHRKSFAPIRNLCVY